MKIRFAHLSITATDLKKLSEFYMKALGFVPALAEKGFSGEWVEKGTGVKGADFRRIHLRLPGSEDSPLLEIIQYTETIDGASRGPANSAGIRHVAFEVESDENLRKLFDLVIRNGGGKLGEISSHRVEGLGEVSFVYMTDPEGNIVELVSWSRE
ncbi:MAG: VOC family protein [Deltaproteobacteria bacterium]